VTLVSWSAWAASTAPDLLSAAGYGVYLSAVGRGFHVHCRFADPASAKIEHEHCKGITSRDIFVTPLGLHSIDSGLVVFTKKSNAQLFQVPRAILGIIESPGPSEQGFYVSWLTTDKFVSICVIPRDFEEEVSGYARVSSGYPVHHGDHPYK